MPEPAIRLTLPDRQAALLGGLFTVIGGYVCLVLALDWPFIARGDPILVCWPAALMFFASQGFPLIVLIWAFVPIIVRKLTNQAPPTHLLALCGVVGMSLLALCALALIPLWMYRSHVETDRRRGILRVRRVRPWRLVTRTYPYDTIDAITVETHAPPNRAPTYGVSILLHDGRPIATGYRSRDPGKASETATRLARRIGCPCTDATA